MAGAAEELGFISQDGQRVGFLTGTPQPTCKGALRHQCRLVAALSYSLVFHSGFLYTTSSMSSGSSVWPSLIHSRIAAVVLAAEKVYPTVQNWLRRKEVSDMMTCTFASE